MSELSKSFYPKLKLCDNVLLGVVQMQQISTQRIRTLDLIRGVAVLGILIINFQDMAFPEDLVLAFHVTDPDKGLNYWFGIIAEIFIAGKFRGIFTLLFGVSSIIIYIKIIQNTKENIVVGIYFYRLLWLLVFGLVNAYLFLWWGDVLFKYAILGVLLFAFQRARFWILTATALTCLAVLTIQPFAEYRELVNLQQKSNYVQYKQQSGQPLTSGDLNNLEQWKETIEDIQPRTESIERESQIKTGSFIGLFRYNLHSAFEEQTYIFYKEDVWDMLLFMILGIMLFRLGFFDERRKQTLHLTTAFFGVGIGLVVHSWMILGIYENPLDPVRLQFFLIFSNLGRLPFVVGYLSLIILVFRPGIFRPIGDWMVAVGRMALSNYLISSIIGAFVFYGFGLALFNQLSRMQVLFVIIVVWIGQIVFSVIWMKRFHYGPFEWLWRSLTYFKAQPLWRRVCK
jgi:uncharacterized protein